MRFFEDTNVITKIYTVLDLTWEKQSVKTKADNRFFHALSIRLEGDSTLSNKNKNFHLSLKKNDLLFMPKKTEYERSGNVRERVIVVHFDALHTYPLPEVFTPSDPIVFLRYFDSLFKTWKKKDIGYAYECIVILNKIMKNILLQQAEKELHADGYGYIVQPAVNYIKENFTNNDFTMEDLARLCHVSTVYFRKIFRQIYGTSPLDYVNDMRLDYATELLAANYYSIEEIAEKCGIPNPKYFSTLYKKKRGVSPSLISR